MERDPVTACTAFATCHIRAEQQGTCSKVWASSSEAYRITELAPPMGSTARGLPSGCVGQSEGSARNTCAKGQRQATLS